MATVTYAWTTVVNEFLANTFELGAQAAPSIVSVNDGAGYFSVWDTGSVRSLRGRLFDASGDGADDRAVNSTNAGDQFDSSVTQLVNGTIVVAFTDTGVDPDGEIRVRRFDSTGAPLGNDFLVAGDALGETDPDVAALADGGFVVTYTSDGDGLRGAIYNANGSGRVDVFYIDFGAGDSRSAQVVGLADGNMAVVWQNQAELGADWTVKYAIYNPYGYVVQSPQVLDTVVTTASSPQILALNDGGFAIAYADQEQYIGTDINFCILNADGSVRSGPVQANTSTQGAQSSPTMALLSNGFIVVGWDTGPSFYSQIFTPAGVAVGDENYIATNVIDGELAGLAGGLIANVWSSSVADISGNSIRSSIEAFVRTTTGDNTNEALTGDDLRDVIYGLGGNDSIDSNGGNDTLDGGGGIDGLRGGSGNDTLLGGAGNDTLTGGDGNDYLDGGDGIDRASYAGAAAGVTVSLATESVQDTGGAGIDRLMLIEYLDGSQFDDQLTGNASANKLLGGAGNDSLTGAAGNDYLAGDAGNDTIAGGDGTDSLYGGLGNDSLDGGEGNDTLDAGAGDDVLLGGGGIDRATYAAATSAVTINLNLTGPQATGGGGNDTLGGIEYLDGSAFDDKFTGDSAANKFLGGNGNDVFIGGAGSDHLAGDGGNDTLDGGAGNDIMQGGAGIDRVTYASATAAVSVNLALVASQVTGGSGSDTLTGVENLNGSAFDDSLAGDAAANKFLGGSGNDALGGAGGNDELFGDAGDDSIAGGAGNDTLTGGTEADRFLFDAALSATDNVDRITDYSVADDSIALDRTVFGALAATGVLAASAFRTGSAAADADDRIIYDAATGRIYYDADGNGAGGQILFAQVTAGLVLTNADFLVTG